MSVISALTIYLKSSVSPLYTLTPVILRLFHVEQSRSTLNRDVFVVFSSLITDAAILLMIDFLTVLFSSGVCI